MSNDPEITIQNMLARIEAGWDELQSYIGQLDENQLSHATDAEGWTVKDHLIHLAVWEGGVYHLLRGDSRLDAMGIDQAAWDEGVDAVNALIQEHYEFAPTDEVLQSLHDLHQSLVDHIKTMSDDDLKQLYTHFDPESQQDRPIWAVIADNTFEHYQEHIPWMKEIASRA